MRSGHLTSYPSSHPFPLIRTPQRERQRSHAGMNKKTKKIQQITPQRAESVGVKKSTASLYCAWAIELYATRFANCKATHPDAHAERTILRPWQRIASSARGHQKLNHTSITDHHSLSRCFNRGAFLREFLTPTTREKPLNHSLTNQACVTFKKTHSTSPSQSTKGLIRSFKTTHLIDHQIYIGCVFICFSLLLPAYLKGRSKA